MDDLWRKNNLNVFFERMLDNLSFSVFQRAKFNINIYEVTANTFINPKQKEAK